MAERNSPKFQRVYNLVISALERGVFKGSRFVPSIASIAEATGVSRFTVWRVMRKLREEGRVGGSARCRNVVAKGADDTFPLPAIPLEHLFPNKSSDLQTRIRRDLVNGWFSPGEQLPPLKTLAHRYGISPRTLRKALGELTRRSLLVNRGTRFLAPSLSPTTSPAGSRIVMFGYGQNLGFNLIWGYWHQEILKRLEFECRRATIELDLVCFTHYDSSLKLIDGRTGEPYRRIGDQSVLGYIYLVTGQSSIDEDLLRRISETKRPVAILDEYGLWPPARYLRQHPLVRVFRNALSATPAQQTARFLLELGHRTAAYISPFHGAAYSQDRLASLQSEYQLADGGRIVAITDNYDSRQSRLYAARINMNSMMAFYREWKKKLPQAYLSIMDDHFNLLYARMHEGRQREYLDDLFGQSLKTEGVTAWILVNDICASYALDFLAQRGISVPHDLSIVSFDDLPIALEKGITSYNFNFPALMQAMLKYCIDPHFFPPKNPIVEIEGEIIPRATTAKGPAEIL